MIDGAKKGVGDIATLTMDKGQYAFAENKMGRFILTVNAKQQSFPGLQVQFLGSTQSTQNQANLSVLETAQIVDGKLEIFSGADVKGSLKVGSFDLNPGAKFEGSVYISSENTKKSFHHKTGVSWWQELLGK